MHVVSLHVRLFVCLNILILTLSNTSFFVKFLKVLPSPISFQISNKKSTVYCYSYRCGSGQNHLSWFHSFIFFNTCLLMLQEPSLMTSQIQPSMMTSQIQPSLMTSQIQPSMMTSQIQSPHPPTQFITATSTATSLAPSLTSRTHCVIASDVQTQRVKRDYP